MQLELHPQDCQKRGCSPTLNQPRRYSRDSHSMANFEDFWHVTLPHLKGRWDPQRKRDHAPKAYLNSNSTNFAAWTQRGSIAETVTIDGYGHFESATGMSFAANIRSTGDNWSNFHQNPASKSQFPNLNRASRESTLRNGANDCMTAANFGFKLEACGGVEVDCKRQRAAHHHNHSTLKYPPCCPKSYLCFIN